eukprot:7386712-Prymnesium_polylepis.1
MIANASLVGRRATCTEVADTAPAHRRAARPRRIPEIQIGVCNVKRGTDGAREPRKRKWRRRASTEYRTVRAAHPDVPRETSLVLVRKCPVSPGAGTGSTPRSTRARASTRPDRNTLYTATLSSRASLSAGRAKTEWAMAGARALTAVWSQPGLCSLGPRRRVCGCKL